MHNPSTQPWRRCDRFLEMRSKWLTLIGEHLQDNQGQILEYWRVEKADSVVILPIQNNQLIMPHPVYRPGVGEITYDFPGGRVPEEKSPEAVVPVILQRELGVEAEAILHQKPLNTQGWAVNSSFSNQRLHGFVAHLQPHLELSAEYIAQTYPVTTTGLHDLLQILTCLQCRAVLLEWWLHQDH